MKAIKYLSVILILLLGNGLLMSCKSDKKPELIKETDVKKELAFAQRKIVDSAKFWWAHTQGDLDGDGLADLVFINNNASGGYLAYYKGQKEPGLWKLHIISESPTTGGLFASGDLECADIDGDGDLDVFAVKHPGEWTDASASAELFWYENTGGDWISHTIGMAPDAVKDVSFADFDKDGNLDMSILTFDEHTLSIFKQLDADNWERVQYIQNDVLHEGMGVGDFNGDQYVDIVATGMIYYNPGAAIEEEWKEVNLDEQWNNQEGDWSRNGTKTCVKDIDGDGNVEIVMAHSERGGYPLAIYKRSGDQFTAHIVKDSIVACHTLQVFDFDLDGNQDILAGVNAGRAINLDKTEFDITIFLNNGTFGNYDEFLISKDGVYNGQAIDYDNDGDIDIFRYPNHESTDFYILENTIID